MKFKLKGVAALAALALLLTSCSGSPVPEAPVTPKGLDLAGQRETCGSGPRHRTFLIAAERAQVDLGLNWRTEAETFGGTVPGPVIEACEGDTVTIRMTNQDTDRVMGMEHGFDSHAFQTDASNFNEVNPGKTLEFTAQTSVPGVFMYHCMAGSATDWHIKQGMYGAMIVYPRKRLRDAKVMVVVESGIYGKPDKAGNIVQTIDQANANHPSFMMFNGKVVHKPVVVNAGQLVRVWFVNVGPGDSSVHVIGSILNRFSMSGNPENSLYDVQTASVPAGGGAMFEFRAPKGKSLLVDHNNLRFLGYGLALPFEGK